MSQEHLTARYRPQTFAQVAGQDAIKRILSRAAATGRIAPAYLFSGTRGVGKTTLARIFAKALNCQNGPGAEPCNTCSICRQITLGASVDVAEIDGASNTGVDHVRRLKEDVGYAPLECRFKVIIIDEAHMLSRAAFNALLKTLEEPPGHVTFILATTEPEKFPQTIISRCQHFVFKRLSQAELVRHLNQVLEQENMQAEPSAVQLLARRGAGSVRDAMSLLAQVLALGSDGLRLSDVREVLGLAGQEVFVRLAECVLRRDLPGLHALLTEILDQGVDLGFFLRELATCWRNLFLLRQLGENARDMIDLPAEDLAIWAGLAPDFELSHLHAAWQMTLDSQRKILTSMEPALALELLLLNLACLPDLLVVGATPTHGISRSQTETALTGRSAPQPPVAGRARSAVPLRTEPAPSSPVSAETPPGRARTKHLSAQAPPKQSPPEQAAQVAEPKARPVSQVTADAVNVDEPKTWEGFVAFCQSPDQGRLVTGLHQARGELQGDELVLTTPHTYLSQRFSAMVLRLSELAHAYYGREVTVRVAAPVQEERKTVSQLRDMAMADPVVREVREIFQARIMDVRPVNNAKEQDV